MNITIIGAGNMGGSTAIGLASRGENVTVTARHDSTLERFRGRGINTSLDNVQAIRGAGFIMLAVKPWIVREVVEQIAPHIDFDSQCIVSFAPGVKPEELREMFEAAVPGCAPSIAYVIPNTAIELCESMTFVAPVSCAESQTQALESIFGKVGVVKRTDMAHLAAGTALASCGIAYALRYIRAASEGGVEMGLYPKDAVQIAAQTVRGAAALLLAHGSHPEVEIDKVTTPGGITIRGLNAMEEAGFTNAVVKGLKAGTF